MNTIFWAKPDQTYDAHIEAAYKAWKETVIAKKNLIQRLSKEFGFNEERFLKSSLLTVVLHDIGKNIEPFQIMMDAKRKGEIFNKRKNYRHELVSFSFAIQGSVALRKQDGVLTLLPLEALAILGHHKKINPDLQSFSRECTSIKPNFYEDGMNKALMLAEEIFLKEGFSLPRIPIHKYDSYADASKLISYDGAFIKIFEKENFESTRIIYLLLKAILHYADWHGSAGMDVNYSLKTHADDLFREIEKRCIEKKIKFNGLRPFQEECAHTLGNIISIAPTGSGKTEASLLWALNNLHNMGGGKLIYLLPTMVTANSIFTRLEDYFSKGNVGLTHSTASFMFQDEEDNPENVRNVLFDKSFINPATVATIDQLLASGFNTGKWTLIEANAANSVIIIDEIHSYDSWTLGLIIESIKHFSKLGTRFMLMSATLPEYLINLFAKVLPNAKIIRDETLLNSCRNRYQIFDKTIDNAILDIEKSVHEGKKTLVVVNNVAKCQELHNKLEDLNPMCYHSKFILKDRTEKEKEIDNQKLLIATQVVEVSLDIDFDVMFTECAPPDAIVQRAGRVNRRREKSDSWISIFKASDISNKIYDPEDTGLLTRSFEIFKNSPEKLTENDLIKIVENVYLGFEIEKSPNFIDANKQYSKTQQRLMSIFDNPNREDRNEVTRKTEYLQIPVIPSTFRDEVLSLPPSQRRMYEVKMPYWYVQKHKEPNEEITFCEMKYDSIIGAQFAEDSQVSSLII
jgi:CRISPR-associated endonuclease/helicase Cas3